MKEIKKLMVEGYGYVYSTDGKIKTFLINGEMSHIRWYRQGNKEFNGKYVIVVEYFEEEVK